MNADDPKFTAHVLGEMEDLTPAERAEIEALLASDSTAAAEAAEIGSLAARLRAELSGEAAAPLAEHQRAAVLEAAKMPVPQMKIVAFPRRVAWLVMAAACAIVGISIGLVYQAMQMPTHTTVPPLAVSSVPASLPADLTKLVVQETFEPSPAQSHFVSAPVPPLPAQPVMPVALQIANAGAMNTPMNTLGSIGTHPATANLTPPPLIVAPGVNANFGSTTVVFGTNMTVTSGVSSMTVTGLLAGGSTVTSFSVSTSAPTGMAAASAPLPQHAGSMRVSGQEVAGTQSAVQLSSPPADTKPATPTIRTQAASLGMAWANPVRRFNASSSLDEADETGVFNTSAFDAVAENDFLAVRDHPLSTFSADVDTASYAIVRRFLNDNHLPPKGAVRTEELLNYFPYDYPQPKGDTPFSATMEVAACPWEPEHRLVRVGLKGREVPRDQRPPSNIVFLIDVSGSMNMPNKLPLLQQAFRLLIEQLGPKDRVAIVTYAGSTGIVLEPTQDKEAMQAAVDRLRAGGSTNGASGVQLAYQVAEKSFIRGGTNRVILATDGDWNVGVTNQSDLLEMIAQKAQSGVFLTVLGFGMDNLKDSMLVKLADRGNGHYAYIDTPLEAKKVFVDQLSGTLMTIAKDVKIQVEFNPAQVGAYRLIGYEKRLLAKEDFNNDKKDAGEIGAGHTVTALYEVVPAGKEMPPIAMVDKLKYATLAPQPNPKVAPVDEILTLKLRYKEPESDTSKLVEIPITDTGTTWEKSSPDFRFAAAVAGYGMLLRDSPHHGQITWESVAEWAHEGLGADKSGYREEFLNLVKRAKTLTR